MVATAELFKNGNSMAVQIPKEFLPANPYEELLIKKTGSMISIFPKSKRLKLFLNGINGFSEDFMKDGRGEDTESPREAMF
jgi:antitoxin VapB